MHRIATSTLAADVRAQQHASGVRSVGEDEGLKQRRLMEATAGRDADGGGEDRGGVEAGRGVDAFREIQMWAGLAVGVGKALGAVLRAGVGVLVRARQVPAAVNVEVVETHSDCDEERFDAGSFE